MHTRNTYCVCVVGTVSLKYGVLGLLAEEPLHGYEVKNRFEAMLGGTWEVNIGQVYTTLQRLERDGLVRPVGSRGDRGKLLYELLESGRTALNAWLSAPDRHHEGLSRRGHWRAERRVAGHRRGRVHSDHGAIRQRQVDAAQPGRRPRPAELRKRDRRRLRPRPTQRNRARAIPPRSNRVRLPVLPPAAESDRARKRPHPRAAQEPRER